MVSELSIANLTTSVTLRVSHSSMPKMASQQNIKKYVCPNYLWIKFCSIKHFLDFSVKRFSRGLNEGSEGVLIGLELAERSLLMADSFKEISRGAIGRLHSIHSIFRPFSKQITKWKIST